MDGWSGGLVGVSFTWLVVFFVGDLQVDWILCPVFFSNLTFRFGRRDSQNLPVAYGLGLRWTDTSKPLWIMRATWCHLACCGDVEHGKPRWTFTSGFHVVQDQFEMDSLSLVELPIFRWGSFSCTVFFFKNILGWCLLMSLLLVGTFILPTLVCEVWSSNMVKGWRSNHEATIQMTEMRRNGSWQDCQKTTRFVSIPVFFESSFDWWNGRNAFVFFGRIPTFFVKELARLCEVIFVGKDQFCHILSGWFVRFWTFTPSSHIVQ